MSFIIGIVNYIWRLIMVLNVVNGYAGTFLSERMFILRYLLV